VYPALAPTYTSPTQIGRPSLQRLVTVVLHFLLGAALASGQERMAKAPVELSEAGVPSFVIYSAQSMGIQGLPSDLQRLPDGRILVVGQRDLCFGDGTRWELFRQDDGVSDPIPKQIAVTPDGHFISPVQDGWAEIVFGDNGRWHFGTPTLFNPLAKRSVADFLHAEHIGSHWYWHSQSGSIVKWDLSGTPSVLGSLNSIDYLFGLHDSVYASDLSNGGLTRFDVSSGASELIDKGEAQEMANTICSSAPLDEESILIGTNARGVQRFDGSHRTPLFRQGVLSGGRRINYLCQTVGGFYAAAVESYGIVFFTREGRILQILGRNSDHRLARVQKLLNTGDGLVWALLSDGVARIEFPSRLSEYESLLDSGLNFVRPYRLGGRLWVHADGRLYQALYAEDGRLTGFVPNNPPTPFVFTFCDKLERPLALCGDAAYEFDGRAWRNVLPSLANARILARSPEDGRWLYAAPGELGWIDFSQHPYHLERIPVTRLSLCYGATLDPAGRLWLELGNSLLARIPSLSRPQEIEFLGTANGIPDGWAATSVIDGELRLCCANRLMRFDEQTRQFQDDKELFDRHPELNDSSGRAMEDARGGLWISPLDSVRIHHNFRSKAKQWLERLPEGFKPNNFWDDESGVVWMHDARRFMRYDPDMPQAAQQPIRVVITRVHLLGSNRTIVMPGDRLPELSYSDNSLSLHFLAPGNPLGQQVSFEFMLEGQQNQWTSTGISGSTLFNRLKEGSYRLRLRPVVGNLPGEETQLFFEIRAPWFRTIYAYLGFGSLGMLAVASAILLPAGIERRNKRLMERLVARRTQELNDTNSLLARQVKETLQKSVALKASEERYRELNAELEKRVNERTEELKRQVHSVEKLNRELMHSQAEISRSASRLQEVNASLLVANHELESFSYTVSHDLRAPLRNVTGFIELLKKRVEADHDPETRRFLDIIISEAKRMGTLIDDLLSFSRIGRTEMRQQSVDLSALVEQCKRDLLQEMAGRQVEWQLQPMPAVLADKALLKQVLANLLGNALKFTRTRETARIEVGCVTGTDLSSATFYVRDNGVGFNPQYIDKLFRVFQRLHSAKDFEGTGIGLANVKRIITRHGGRVWAEGSPDGGATFYFTLKLANPGTNAIATT
jgi:signal transduction histidine kinase